MKIRLRIRFHKLSLLLNSPNNNNSSNNNNPNFKINDRLIPLNNRSTHQNLANNTFQLNIDLKLMHNNSLPSNQIIISNNITKTIT